MSHTQQRNMLAQQNTVEQDFAQHWWLIDSTTRVVCVTCLRVLCKSSIHFTAPRKLPTRRTPVSNSSVTCARLCRHFLIRGKETTADSTLRLISSKLQMRWVDVLCRYFAYAVWFVRRVFVDGLRAKFGWNFRRNILTIIGGKWAQWLSLMTSL